MEKEACKCSAVYPIVLQFSFNEWPFVCSNCNLSTKTKPLESNTMNAIKKWNKEYEIAYKNWLNNDENSNALSDPSSSLNQSGLSIVQELNKVENTYYWWHLSSTIHLTECPNCNSTLDINKNLKIGLTKFCEHCKILLRE